MGGGMTPEELSAYTKRLDWSRRAAADGHDARALILLDEARSMLTPTFKPGDVAFPRVELIDLMNSIQRADIECLGKISGPMPHLRRAALIIRARLSTPEPSR